MHLTICYFCTAFKDLAVNAVSGTESLYSGNDDWHGSLDELYIE